MVVNRAPLTPTPIHRGPSLSSEPVEPDDAFGDDEGRSPLLPPDDRLWRHPSEVVSSGPSFDRRGRPRPRRLWLVAGLAGATSAVFTVGLIAVTGGLRERVRTVPAVERVAVPASVSGSGRADMERLAEQLRPAIVRIEIAGASGPALASGVMLRSDGHLITSSHLVDGAGRITVVLAGGREVAGRLVGADSGSDIAVVKVDDQPHVTVAPLGSAGRLRVGQEVMAIGGGKPVWVGPIRALGHEIEREGASPLLDMIQTDGPPAPGSSGGALADGSGAVVGITTTVATGTVVGSRYAVPIDYARAVAEQLIATGRTTKVWLGIEGANLDAATARSMGLAGGALVRQVREGSPAGRAGLRANDVITSVDEVPVETMGALKVALRRHRPGDMVTLSVLGPDGARTVRVKLVERPPQG